MRSNREDGNEKSNRQGAKTPVDEEKFFSHGVSWRVGGSLILVVCVALLSGTAVPAFAQSTERIWGDANQAVFAGDLASASTKYQLLIDAGVRDADVYFNAGIAHARQGQFGNAALDFERSLWLRPGDATTEQELAAVYSALGKRRAERAGEALMRTRPPLSEALVRPLSADSLAVFVLLLDLAFFAILLVLRRPLARESWKLGLTIAAPLVALLLLLSGTALAIKSEWLRSGDAALVLREQAELREGPDPRAQVRAHAYEGQGARVQLREGGYVSVALDGGQSGWMKSSDLGTIRAD
jgi:tetratricopeptide (TPR) repeat protein